MRRITGKNKGVLDLDNMTQVSNSSGLNTKILSKRVPRSEVYVLKSTRPFQMFVPTREEFTHAGNGEEEFSLTGDIVDSSALGDVLTAIACTTADESTLLTVASIDYAGNKVTVDHDTNETIYIYYLFNDGDLSINVVAPFASGNLNKSLWEGSTLNIHLRNQYSKQGRLYLRRSFIVPETYVIEVWIKSDTVVYWHPDNKIGHFFLEFVAEDKKLWPAGKLEEKAKSEMISS